MVKKSILFKRSTVNLIQIIWSVKLSKRQLISIEFSKFIGSGMNSKIRIILKQKMVFIHEFVVT